MLYVNCISGGRRKEKKREKESKEGKEEERKEGWEGREGKKRKEGKKGEGRKQASLSFAEGLKGACFTFPRLPLPNCLAKNAGEQNSTATQEHQETGFLQSQVESLEAP